MAFLSDTPSTRRYGAPCVIGEYMSLFLRFTAKRSPSALYLSCVSLAAETSAY